jgi:hypothetical protein
MKTSWSTFRLFLVICLALTVAAGQQIARTAERNRTYSLRAQERMVKEVRHNLLNAAVLWRGF